jgi:hypothetical protein
MKLHPPYFLFLGNATDHLSVKIANGIVDWRPELCVGEFRLDGCTITKGLDSLTLAEAKARGARTMVVALNNSGGYIEPDTGVMLDINPYESRLKRLYTRDDRWAKVH